MTHRPSPPRSALAAARAAEAGGDPAAIRAAWSALAEVEPDDPRWVLRAADAGAPISDDPTWTDPLVRAVFALQRGQRPTLDAIPLFADLGAAADAVAAACTRRRISAGEVVLHEGEVAQALFLVVAGALSVYRTDPFRGEVTLGALSAGAVFGEMALILDRPRAASVRAETEVELLAMSLSAVEAVAQPGSAARAALKTFTRRRLLINLLSTSQIFGPVSASTRAALVDAVVTIDAVAGQVLIQEGAASEALWVVQRGAVEVHKTDGPIERLLARLGPGEVFGEIALLGAGRATATVTAREPARVLSVPGEAITAACAADPALRDRLQALGAERTATNRFVLADDIFIERAD